MTTRAEIIGRLAERRLRRHYLPNLTRAQVKTAAQTLTNADWDAIIGAIRDRSEVEIGEVLSAKVQGFLLDLAQADIQNAVDAGGKIDIDDLIELI